MAFLNQRLSGLKQSPIRAMTRACHRAGGINLGQGVCDVSPPAELLEAAREEMNAPRHMYSLAEGELALREAICRKLERDNKVQADPNDNVMVTIGASGAFTAGIHALLNPGDGILTFEPYYGYHVHSAQVAGLDVQYCRLNPEDFSFDWDAVRSAIRPNTRAVVFSSPNNPCGRMLSQDDFDQLATIADEHDLLVFADEIYEYFRYDNRPHISTAAHDGLSKRTVTIMGLSKTYSITGWRLGYAVGPAELIKPMTLMGDLQVVCAPTPLQRAATVMMDKQDDYVASIPATYQPKRDRLCDALQSAGLNPVRPQGAYYVMADVSSLGCTTAEEAAMQILDQAGVATVPGNAFYHDDAGERFVRLCYGKEDDVLADACERLQRMRKAA